MTSTLVDITDEPKFSLRKQLREERLELTLDGSFVRWMRNNPQYPRNWSTTRKIYDTGLVCILDLFVTASSTAGAGAAAKAKDEYHLDSTVAIFCFVTLFLLGQSLGNVVLPPWSESFGRKRIYIISSGISCICSVTIGFLHSLPGAIIMRILAGIFSAVPATVVGGTIEDLFDTRARIWVVFFWTIASNIGLIIGPIMSAFIIEALDWRWVFYVYAIILAGITGLLCFIRESRSSCVLSCEINRLRQVIPNIPPPLNHDHSPDMRTFVTEALFRPVQLFFREPIIFAISMMISVAMSLIYIFTEALQPIYESMGFTASQASLIFMAIGLGTCVSTLTRILDCYIYNSRRSRNLPIKPEHKLAGLAIGVPFLAIGLWWFGWTIPPKVEGPNVPWIVPTLSLVLVGYALTELDTVLYAYISDSYLSYSASATAAVAFMRGLLSATFPLFTKQMFSKLGANIAMSILATVATIFCIVPPLFLCYGEEIRRRSHFAKYSWEIQDEMGKDEDDI
ncbi:uncharacterized protein N7484_006151 [Penicillium longicatenatum]|uniref:uncharacterized protein n=1 Tax=Penicillium longicatenatum TaxID=1561947 RepID=UPI0025477DD0|nr:uncharacterized protein N7484_006151 [Penicillium longicatenatum]KAJ5643644.1 hypothetical protein N7484_006151 [Penicillium longicatenatum]